MRHAVGRFRKKRRPLTTSIPVFALSVLAFGAAIMLPWLMRGTVAPDASLVDGVQGKQRSLLLLVHDGHDELTAAVVIHTDTRTLSVQVTGYPAQTEVACGTDLSTLGRRYAEEGVAVGQYLSALSGEAYDATLRMSVSGIAAFVAECGGGVVYTLPEPIGRLPLGEQTLSSLQVADVLRYDGWMQNLTGRAEAHAGIVTAIINRYLVSSRNLEALFKSLTAFCEDSISIAQFSAVRDELEALAGANRGAICRACVPAGRAVGYGEDRRFVVEG